MFKRKHIIIIVLCLSGILGGMSSGIAQATISSPQIHCIAVDSVGNVTLTWTIPSDTNNTFLAYDIYSSSNVAGPYSSSTVINSKTQNSVTINGLNANAAPVYFYMVTNTANGASTPGDSLESIFLTVNNLGTGIAFLKWNAMHNPPLATFNGWYKIYREYPQYVWTLVDSTKNLAWNDTITICSASINYKIVTSDASGCQSVSNIAGGTFKNIIVPAIPPLDTVSVNPNGSVDISWYPSSSADVTGYIVYKWSGGAWVAIDTVYGHDSTYYNYTAGSPGSGSESFRIAAFDSCNNSSPLDNVQATLYLTQTPDKCAQENVLSWNKYVNLLPGVAKYNVYVSTNGGSFKLLATVDTTTYTHTNLSTPESLCYYVQVVSTGKPAVTASSNIICYQVTLPPPPKFSYLRSATVIGNSTQNQVNCYIDTGARIAQYLIQRASSPGSKYTTIGTMPATNSVFFSFTDPSANPNIQSYTYRVLSKDSCNYVVDTTNIGQTIYLTAVGDNTGKNTLNWNDYTWWAGNVTKYDIYRDEDSGPYSLIASVPYTAAGQNAFTDDVSSIIQGQGIFGYYVQAIEGPSSYPFTDTSTSNIAEAYQDPRVYIPNAFDPKGLVNTIFKPVGVFVDLQSYDFSIYNRWGQLIYETNDTTQGWDGTFHGHLVPEGVYVYHLTYTSGKGEYFTRNGSVLMLK